MFGATKSGEMVTGIVIFWTAFFSSFSTSNADPLVANTIKRCTNPYGSLKPTIDLLMNDGWGPATITQVNLAARMSAEGHILAKFGDDPFPDDASNNAISNFVIKSAEKNALSLQYVVNSDDDRVQLLTQGEKPQMFLFVSNESDNHYYQLSCRLYSTAQAPDISFFGIPGRIFGFARSIANPDLVNIVDRRTSYDKNDPSLYSADIELLIPNKTSIADKTDYQMVIGYYMWLSSSKLNIGISQ